jgi:low temperature requirement protein LtrA
LELFYDLVYVTAIIQLGNGLSTHPGFVGFFQFGLIFFFLWYTWAQFSCFYNRYNIDDAIQRLLVFFQMFAVGGMAVSVAQVFDGIHLFFIVSLVVARLMTVAMYFSSWRSGGQGGEIGRVYAVLGLIGAVLWAGSLALPTPWIYFAWGVAALVDLYAPLGRRAREAASKHPTDGGHLVERFGLLTIIVLGEMFVKVLTEVSETPWWRRICKCQRSSER